MANDNKPEPLVNERTRLLTTDSSSDGSHDGDFDSSSSSSLIDTSPPSVYGTSDQPDEEQCDQETTTSESGTKTYSNRFISRVVLALLVGVFTGSADGSLVIATHPVIASEFNDLENSTWLFISFLLAGAATQSLYGKLSDIYGRKPVLLTSYALFAIGSTLIGIGQSMWQVIVGRVISGSGGAGIMTLAAVIITDLAPLRDVASWQSYLNVVATVGRSLGGPTGGFLADTIGWRWSFLGQAPIFLLAMALCWMILPNLTTEQSKTNTETTKSRLARIDFLGASLLGGGLLAVLLPLRIAGQKVPWGSPVVLSLFAIGILLLALFTVAEIRWAKEPIFPLRLLKNRDVVFSYLIMVLQTAAQVGMMVAVPLYFQVTERSSSTVAGAHLMPAVIGNTIGGLLTGAWIRRTGYFKAPLVFAGIISFICYGLLILRWNGKTNWIESLYIFPGGFGTGISANAVFVALQAAINPIDKAVAASGLYLSIPVGSILGMAACNAVMQATMPVDLASRLRKLGVEKTEAEQIIKQATARIDYLDEAPPRIAQAVSEAYVRGLEFSHGVSLICAILAIICALLMRSRKLR
ncbi:Vacuolar membrane amino acid uptake transporter fnx2 [Daldinia childiae]|uniref:Vacuolar membrane amino acid uptake transporter fnx2 n=1 Tax=Daldinia childiae TaxID=326645 RepID=UPI00144545E6|nr:Vacuolar membrane amino acid uptake transporter fnx2 [Daldinia childiae]KAF3061750.1 Vacuolar membrane amino acid uptake transporter fnx2 [Daldinia childiae]